MKIRGIVGAVAGAVLLASALAHAMAGWPPLRAALEASNVDSQLIGAIAAGWFFGSASMLAFGLIVLMTALEVLRGREVSFVPARVIAAVYTLFGLAAFVLRDMNPHFLVFVATGVLVGLFAFPASRR